ncbi:hypothetical protein BFG52_05805 [Acinetobacter larvae]|uniref:Uncharacterized protein n=1 Tax=Acinetobacter larvae TaxID=1789224 RepID=A0A1B2LY77_9GAMM|nr:hypothetical protein BFG52_05805 [Acinetobacter larvae]
MSWRIFFDLLEHDPAQNRYFSLQYNSALDMLWHWAEYVWAEYIWVGDRFEQDIALGRIYSFGQDIVLGEMILPVLLLIFSYLS